MVGLDCNCLCLERAAGREKLRQRNNFTFLLLFFVSFSLSCCFQVLDTGFI